MSFSSSEPYFFLPTTVTDNTYPAVAQFIFDFRIIDGDFLLINETNASDNQEIFFSFNGKNDHGSVKRIDQYILMPRVSAHKAWARTSGGLATTVRVMAWFGG